MMMHFIPGAPGGPELLVLLLTAALYIGVLLLIIVAVYNYLDGKRSYEQRIETLEHRVNELENEQS